MTASKSAETSSKPSRSFGASPVVAAMFVAGTVYVWLEAAFRLAFTYNASFDASYVLFSARDGDIAAMWLTAGVVSALVFLALAYGVFRGKQRVGSLAFWTIVLTLSVILAPLIGEIGTPIGI
jgi:hypothetical protein